MKNTKLSIILGIVLSVIGIIVLLVGINSLNSNNKFKKENIKITATATDVNKDLNYTVVSFFVDEQEYNSMIQKYSSDINVGDKIEVYYNKSNPAQVGFGENKFIGIYFATSILLLLVGLSIIIHKLNNTSVNKEALMNIGKRIEAEIDDIIYNSKVSANGKHPYYVICSWKNKMNGQKYMFKSENVWFNPEEQLKKFGIDTLPVYIMPSDPKQYYVDINSINVKKED